MQDAIYIYCFNAGKLLLWVKWQYTYCYIHTVTRLPVCKLNLFDLPKKPPRCYVISIAGHRMNVCRSGQILEMSSNALTIRSHCLIRILFAQTTCRIAFAFLLVVLIPRKSHLLEHSLTRVEAQLLLFHSYL